MGSRNKRGTLKQMNWEGTSRPVREWAFSFLKKLISKINIFDVRERNINNLVLSSFLCS